MRRIMRHTRTGPPTVFTPNVETKHPLPYLLKNHVRNGADYSVIGIYNL